MLIILNLWNHDDDEVDHSDEAYSAHSENTKKYLVDCLYLGYTNNDNLKMKA